MAAEQVRTLRINNADWQTIREVTTSSGLPVGKALGMICRGFEYRTNKILKKFEMEWCGGIDPELFQLFSLHDYGTISTRRLGVELKRLKKRWERGDFKDRQPRDYSGAFEETKP